MLIKGRFPKEILLVLYLILMLASTGGRAEVLGQFESFPPRPQGADVVENGQAASPPEALDQPVDEEHPFGIEFDDDTARSPQNGAVTVEFRFTIPDQYYLYSEKMDVTVFDTAIQKSIALPEAVKMFDPFSEAEKDVYYNEVVIPVTFVLPADYDQNVIAGEIEYQGCSDKLCFRQMSQPFSIPLVLPSPSAATDESATPGFFTRLLSRSLDLSGEKTTTLYVMAFVLGILSSFSVCVLPLVPLTIAFMGARKEEASRAKMAGLLSLFLAGLVSMNAPLGLMAAWLGLKLGFQYQNPYFLVGVTLLFLFVGVWMLGVFNLQLPNRLQTAVSRWQPRGYAKAYVSGLTIGILAFACIGPFLLPLMTFVAGSGSFLTGVSVMIVFSLGMSLLFVFAAFFTSAWIRRFGSKSFLLKRLTGLAMLGFAVYFGWIFTKSYLLPPPVQSAAFFQSDFEAAQKLAEAQHKNLLIDFYADWCLPCQRWEIEVWSKSQLQAGVAQNFVPLKVDCTTDTEFCDAMTERFKIRGMPTLVFLRADGSEFNDSRLEGVVMTPEELLAYLQTLR